MYGLDAGHPIDIVFSTNSTLRASHACRVCRSRDNSQKLTLSAPWVGTDAPLELFECRSCGSFFYDGPNPALSYSDLDEGEAFWLDYVQAGAGISSMLAPNWLTPGMVSVPGTNSLRALCVA